MNGSPRPRPASPEVVEEAFEVRAGSRRIPGLMWTPADPPGPVPMVLIGHGATRHKRIDYVLALARRLVRHHGLAAAAIDGPGHGDRRSAPADEVTLFGEFLSEWSRPDTVDDMIADWQAAMAHLLTRPEVDPAVVGYWGLSMGTIYGIPLAAAEPSIAAAVFGLMGLVGPTRDRLAVDAGRLGCPVAFVTQWDDTLVPRQESLDLFAAIASTNKRLHAYPGDHAQVPPEELVFSAGFLADHLHALRDAARADGEGLRFPEVVS
ncbi:MAG: alpha/beta hydrolase [Acidimicrobiales bacterium]